MCGETESMFVDASFGAFDRPSRPSEVRSSEVADFCLLGWLAGWLVGLLAGWLACWLVGLLAGWLVGWLDGWLAAASRLGPAEERTIRRTPRRPPAAADIAVAAPRWHR